MWLYIRVQGAEDERIPEKDRPDHILETGKKVPKSREVHFDDVQSILGEYGYEVAPPLTPHTPASAWPYTAIVYTKFSKNALGRTGSAVHRFALREVEK